MAMLFSVTIRSEDEIPKMKETTGYFTVISFSFQNLGFVRFKAYEPLCLFSIRDCHGQLLRHDHSKFNPKQEKHRERMDLRVTPDLKEKL